jgi:hypothetical protein
MAIAITPFVMAIMSYRTCTNDPALGSRQHDGQSLIVLVGIAADEVRPGWTLF